jgi:hypothetical protein
MHRALTFSQRLCASAVKNKAFVFFLPSGIYKANKFPARIDIWTKFRLYYGQYVF